MSAAVNNRTGPLTRPVDADLGKRSDSLTDLALTLPIFVVYHLGVVFLPVRNAADPVSGRLAELAHESLLTYFAITVAIGVAFVLLLLLLSLLSLLSLFLPCQELLFSFFGEPPGCPGCLFLFPGRDPGI